MRLIMRCLALGFFLAAHLRSVSALPVERTLNPEAASSSSNRTQGLTLHNRQATKQILRVGKTKKEGSILRVPFTFNNLACTDIQGGLAQESAFLPSTKKQKFGCSEPGPTGWGFFNVKTMDDDDGRFRLACALGFVVDPHTQFCASDLKCCTYSSSP